jgi:hypothetical protein
MVQRKLQESPNASFTNQKGWPAATDDPPPLKWSDSKYGFLPEEDCNAEEETQA